MGKARFISEFTEEKRKELGFKEFSDGSEHPYGYRWELENNNYCISVDAFSDVELRRKENDVWGEGLKLLVWDIIDLEAVITWIGNYEV